MKTALQRPVPGRVLQRSYVVDGVSSVADALVRIPSTPPFEHFAQPWDEIAGWLDYSTAEKLVVLESLEERRRTGTPH